MRVLIHLTVPMRVLIRLAAPCDWFVLPARCFPLVFVNRKYANVY
jgi:hypothetical protein